MIQQKNTAFDDTLRTHLQQIGTPIRLHRGRIIYLQGQPPQFLYYLVRGQVRSFLLSDDGAERTLALYGAGSVFGEASFFDEEPRMSSAAAVTDCDIVAVSREQILQLFQQKPDMALAMLKYISQTVRLLSDQVDHITFLSADQRLIRTLLSLAEEDNTLTITQDALADAVGVSRVTVSRCLRRLSAAGLIRTGYGCTEILDRASLARWIKS
jgi:CRP/FNR family cyclic AMP-dependent transcriptional regulator